MLHDRERIQADLRGLLQGEVHCNDVFVQMYASDASIYEIRPLGVVRPKNNRDVIAVVQYANENQIPLHARGAGTGLAGESLGPGLILDFAHSMRRIVWEGEETVRVQPGVVLGKLNQRLSAVDRCFGPDPANRSVTTIGSVLAIDAGGSHWAQYGSARSHVEKIRIVLANGQEVEFGQYDLPFRGGFGAEIDRLSLATAQLISNNQQLIQTHKPKSLVNRCGYRLDDVMGNNRLDMAKLMVGTEGTLGIITEATIRTSRLPKHSGLILLACERLENAANAAQLIRKHDVAACDLMDRRLLQLACESDERYNHVLPKSAEAVLLVEKTGESFAEVREGLQQIAKQTRQKKLAFDSKIALEHDDVELLCRLTHRVVPTLYRLKGSTRPLPFVEDIAIPPDELSSFLVRVQNVLKKHQVTASLFAHAAHGQLHIRPFLDLADPEHVRRMQHLARDLYAEVLDVKGTISGEHADGLSRTWFVREQYGPLYDVFVQLKQLFDPQNRLNPGKIIDESGQSLAQNLRPVQITTSQTELSDSSEPDALMEENETSPNKPIVQLELNWTPDDMTLAARSCNGCGGCRTTSDIERMCPMFRIVPAEEATPRAKANLMRAIMTGRLDPEVLGSDAISDIADLCFHCHQCRVECPASVDIPKLVTECKAQYVAQKGLPLSDTVLSRIDSIAAWGSWISPLFNWGIRRRRVRWVMEKVLGIAQGRKLPPLSNRSFLRKAARRKWTRSSRRAGRKVLYFVDVYANWFDTQLGRAVVRVFEHNGISVFVHPRQAAAGMPLIALGATERAKRLARKNVSILADAVRQGYHIIASEPAAAMCLTREYVNLLDDEDAVLVAENSSEACAYLWRMHLQGQLQLDMQPSNLTVAYHQPCHAKAMDDTHAGENLLRLIPNLMVQKVERGCSGMAGTFGLKKENYWNSLRIGRGLMDSLRHPEIQVGTTECSACRIQMEQGTNKPTVHPIKLLAHAYGLMPEIGQLLNRTSEELVTS